MVDVTSVVLGLITLLGGCGWFIDRRKHRQEIESMKADIRRKELDLGTEFVQRYRELITGPLEEDVGKLRIEIKELMSMLVTLSQRQIAKVSRHQSTMQP